MKNKLEKQLNKHVLIISKEKGLDNTFFFQAIIKEANSTKVIHKSYATSLELLKKDEMFRSVVKWCLKKHKTTKKLKSEKFQNILY